MIYTYLKWFEPIFKYGWHGTIHYFIVFGDELNLGINDLKLHCNFNMKKRLLLRCIHHFKSDLIHNMDHMRISGTEPSSVIFSQTKKFKSWKVIPKKCQIKLKPKGMV